MLGIQQVPVTSIDPESKVNVRRTAVEENVEKVKRSIETHGYWPDQPITLRPHPDADSEYEYQYVVGQCRFTAASQLGIEAIPALVLELTDDEAIRRSWTENEARGALTSSDKAHWAEFFYNKFSAEGLTDAEARQKTAKWMGVTEATFRNYFPLAFLPEPVKQMMDQKRLTEQDGRLIAQNTDQNDELMVERAEWLANQPTANRRIAREVITDAGGTVSVAELEQGMKQEVQQRKHVIPIAIPDELYDGLLSYGKDRGIDDPATIVSHIIAETIRTS